MSQASIPTPSRLRWRGITCRVNYKTGSNFTASRSRNFASAIEPLPHIEALTARAEELMRAAGSEAELIKHERTHISRLRPT
jgi:hypothetical protein